MLLNLRLACSSAGAPELEPPCPQKAPPVVVEAGWCPESACTLLSAGEPPAGRTDTMAVLPALQKV